MALKAECDEPFDERGLMDAIWGMVYQLFGEFGASQTALALVKYDKENKVVIVRCSHKALDMIRTAVAAVTKVSGECAAIHMIAVSGTLKALRKKLPE